MNSNEAPEAHVVIEGIQHHHLSTVGKILKPIWQWACYQQRLPVKNNLQISIEKANKPPFCAWSFKVVIVQV